MYAEHGEVWPSYHQFYLDRDRRKPPPIDDLTDVRFTTQLEEHDGFVYVGTWRYGGPGDVAIELHDGEPGEPDGQWQHQFTESSTPELPGAVVRTMNPETVVDQEVIDLLARVGVPTRIIDP
jgi:hypothetical protein